MMEFLTKREKISGLVTNWLPHYWALCPLLLCCMDLMCCWDFLLKVHLNELWTFMIKNLFHFLFSLCLQHNCYKLVVIFTVCTFLSESISFIVSIYLITSLWLPLSTVTLITPLVYFVLLTDQTSWNWLLIPIPALLDCPPLSLWAAVHFLPVSYSAGPSPLLLVHWSHRL